MAPRESRSILVVEDSPEDFEVISRLIRDGQPDAKILHATRAHQAFELLRGHEKESLASLILLDLNLPGLAEYRIAISRLCDFWLQTVKLPQTNRRPE